LPVGESFGSSVKRQWTNRVARVGSSSSWVATIEPTKVQPLNEKRGLCGQTV
jgi:hypothetical protein